LHTTPAQGSPLQTPFVQPLAQGVSVDGYVVHTPFAQVPGEV
jgi:hypothetical protein